MLTPTAMCSSNAVNPRPTMLDPLIFPFSSFHSSVFAFFFRFLDFSYSKCPFNSNKILFLGQNVVTFYTTCFTTWRDLLFNAIDFCSAILIFIKSKFAFVNVIRQQCFYVAIDAICSTRRRMSHDHDHDDDDVARMMKKKYNKIDWFNWTRGLFRRFVFLFAHNSTD